jgi:parvulin-like peptidyl-prolyl isomerase
MSFRYRRQARPSLRTRLGRLVEGDERQQAVVTAVFIGIIVLVILTLVGAVAIAWYNDNLRPLARIGSVEIGPQLMRDRVTFETWRIDRDQNRVTQAQIDGEIDATTAAARLSALDQQLQALDTQGLEDLIDIIYQAQLASGEGITVSQADVDARLAAEFAGVEQRHVLEIWVKPQAADASAGPTVTEREAALAVAQQALAALDAGTDWATVAHQYSNADSEPAGGDLGLVKPNKISDLEFQKELFELPLNGITPIVRGDDDVYRIGRVTEIVSAGEQAGLREGLVSKLPEANVRQLLTWEAAAGALHDKITDAALAATPEQARIAVIYVEGLIGDDPSATEGEIDYSEIVFAPNDDIETAPELPAEDAAWTAALTDAQTVYDQLKAITDVEQRKTNFAEIAQQDSDSDTGQDGGSVGFVTRDLPPTAVGDALFGDTFEDGDLVGPGPVRADAAYYVLMFHERRASPEARIQVVKDALAAPGADFNEVAGRLGEGPEKDDGGEIGWLTRDQLDPDIGNTVFALSVGQVTDPPVELGEGNYFIKLEEKGNRPLDPDQVPNIRATAFTTWYGEKKTAAEADGTIVRADEAIVTDGLTDDGLPQ